MSRLALKQLHTHCPQCRTEMPVTERLCGVCFLDRGEYLAAFASARRWILGLAIVGGIWTLFVCYGLSQLDDTGSMSRRLLLVAPPAVVTLCYFGLWLWAKKQPLAAAVVALTLFVILQLVSALTDPSAFWDSVTNALALSIRILILITLVDAVRAGLKVQRIRAEYARRKTLTPA